MNWKIAQDFFINLCLMLALMFFLKILGEFFIINYYEKKLKEYKNGNSLSTQADRKNHESN